MFFIPFMGEDLKIKGIMTGEHVVLLLFFSEKLLHVLIQPIL